MKKLFVVFGILFFLCLIGIVCLFAIKSIQIIADGEVWWGLLLLFATLAPAFYFIANLLENYI